MLLSQPDSPTTNPLSQLAQKMFSDENNSNSEIMLAAIVSLLLVILFVVLLHVYAKWFLAQSQLQSRARRRQPPATVTGAPGTSHFHHMNIETTPPISTKGLDSATVSAIPTFVCEYETEEAETEEGKTEEFECVICLSVIEEGEIGRRLPKCGHAFHVECIDMWLSSHCNCPICRAPIVVNQNDSQLGSVHGDDGDFEIVIGTPSYDIGESGSVSVSEETSLSLLLGYTLKRMLSKVFLSSHVNELDGSQ